jgi:hypothetical protein
MLNYSFSNLGIISLGRETQKGDGQIIRLLLLIIVLQYH